MANAAAGETAQRPEHRLEEADPGRRHRARTRPWSGPSRPAARSPQRSAQFALARKLSPPCVRAVPPARRRPPAARRSPPAPPSSEAVDGPKMAPMGYPAAPWWPTNPAGARLRSREPLPAAADRQLAVAHRRAHLLQRPARRPRRRHPDRADQHRRLAPRPRTPPTPATTSSQRLRRCRTSSAWNPRSARSCPGLRPGEADRPPTPPASHRHRRRQPRRADHPDHRRRGHPGAAQRQPGDPGQPGGARPTTTCAS